MASDDMRVRLHLRQVRVLAVVVDTPSELVVEVESTLRRLRLLAASLYGVSCQIRPLTLASFQVHMLLFEA